MSFGDLWAEYVRQYPEWGSAEHIISLKARGLKNVVESFYKEGVEAGVKVGRYLEKSEENKKSGDSKDAMDGFKGVFGGL